MGAVWRGRDRETGARYAIKVLPPEYARSATTVARFVRERTALVSFQHPNVVTLHDMIVEGDRLALVMDLVEGGDLEAYRQQRGGAVSRGDALGLTAQICDGLAAAHAAGIVHRDLKPANVLLDAGRVRLADFGIARITDESFATTTGTVLGTVAFMAPEVIKGQEAGPPCDVYAVGITRYLLLTGAPPFVGQVPAIMHGHLETAPPRPNGIPDRLWALIGVCLSKDPAARPGAAALAHALRDPARRPSPDRRRPCCRPGAFRHSTAPARRATRAPKANRPPDGVGGSAVGSGPWLPRSSSSWWGRACS
jgi:serine/threonine-protein kinase